MAYVAEVAPDLAGCSHRRALEAVQALLVLAESGAGLEEILRLVVYWARRLLDADTAVLVLADPGASGNLSVAAVDGTESRDESLGEVWLGDSLLTEALHTSVVIVRQAGEWEGSGLPPLPPGHL